MQAISAPVLMQQRADWNIHAPVFVPGLKHHPVVTEAEYLKKTLETLSSPGGVPSATFHIKFKADHGMDWIPKWAGVEKLEDFVKAKAHKKHDVCRWVEMGKLMYATKEVMLQRVFVQQIPPRPFITHDGKTSTLVIMPMVDFDLREFEMHDELRARLSAFTIDGINVRVTLKGESESTLKFLSSHPWKLAGLDPWFGYDVSVQYYSHNQLTSFSAPVGVAVSPNHVWEFQSWDNEKKWLASYNQYKDRLNMKDLRKIVKKYIDLRTWKNNLKKSKANAGFSLDNIFPVRITMISSHSILDNVQKAMPSYPDKVWRLISEFGETVMAVHVLLTNAKGKRRLAIMKGFTKETRQWKDIAREGKI